MSSFQENSKDTRTGMKEEVAIREAAVARPAVGAGTGPAASERGGRAAEPRGLPWKVVAQACPSLTLRPPRGAA